jgi:hypothetical protein
VWETVQVVLGAVFFFFLLFGTTEGKISLVLALVLVVLVLAQRFVLTPELQAIGKLLDFASPVAMLGERAKFRVVHTSYVVVELGKWAIQLVLAAMLIARGRARSGNAGQQFNVVDKANHRHINR